jgi:hypothetical protein
MLAEHQVESRRQAQASASVHQPVIFAVFASSGTPAKGKPNMKWCGAFGVIVVAMAAGCSADHPSSTPTGAASYGCGQVSADRWADVAPRSADEPTLRLPQPPNWKRVNWADANAPRLVLRDDNVGTQLSPSVVVTITDMTGHAPNPQAVIDTERNNVNSVGATDVTDTRGTVCGFAAGTFAYKTDRGAPAARAVKTVAMAPQYNNKLFDVVVTVQAGDAGDQAYLSDAQTILTGMEIKAPH